MASAEASGLKEPMACTSNSDFAIICSFFEQLGDKLGLLFPSFQDLQHMLENVDEAPYPLVELHVKLMRKLKKSVSFDRWEKAAAKFVHTYSDQDGWEIERFGYKKANIGIKLRLLKNLLEAQFDGNLKFKTEINKQTSDELRLQPLGKDVHGRRYWHLLDDDCNLRVYREDVDEETWDLVCSDKESMVKLIEQLTSGKDLSEEDETSPSTSEENSNTNSQEGFTKNETESQNPVEEGEGPSDAKRLKPDPATAEVSEAIESPVLLVKGEGNGADCETGNPGDGSSTSEPCPETESSESGVGGSQSVDGGSVNKLKNNTCVESSEPTDSVIVPQCQISDQNGQETPSSDVTDSSDHATKELPTSSLNDSPKPVLDTCETKQSEESGEHTPSTIEEKLPDSKSHGSEATVPKSITTSESALLVPATEMLGDSPPATTSPDENMESREGRDSSAQDATGIKESPVEQAPLMEEESAPAEMPLIVSVNPVVEEPSKSAESIAEEVRPNVESRIEEIPDSVEENCVPVLPTQEINSNQENVKTETTPVPKSEETEVPVSVSDSEKIPEDIPVIFASTSEPQEAELVLPPISDVPAVKSDVNEEPLGDTTVAEDSTRISPDEELTEKVESRSIASAIEKDEDVSATLAQETQCADSSMPVIEEKIVSENVEAIEPASDRVTRDNEVIKPLESQTEQPCPTTLQDNSILIPVAEEKTIEENVKITDSVPELNSIETTERSEFVTPLETQKELNESPETITVKNDAAPIAENEEKDEKISSVSDRITLDHEVVKPLESQMEQSCSTTLQITSALNLPAEEKAAEENVQKTDSVQDFSSTGTKQEPEVVIPLEPQKESKESTDNITVKDNGAQIAVDVEKAETIDSVSHLPTTETSSNQEIGKPSESHKEEVESSLYATVSKDNTSTDPNTDTKFSTEPQIFVPPLKEIDELVTPTEPQKIDEDDSLVVEILNDKAKVNHKTSAGLLVPAQETIVAAVTSVTNEVCEKPSVEVKNFVKELSPEIKALENEKEIPHQKLVPEPDKLTIVCDDTKTVASSVNHVEAEPGVSLVEDEVPLAVDPPSNVAPVLKDDEEDDDHDPTKELVIAESPTEPMETTAEEKTEEKSEEKSVSFNQLSFDYDASSAPVAIVLPPRTSTTEVEESPAAKKRGRKRAKRSLGGSGAENGDDEPRPAIAVRQSSRIAKLREKEDEERRKQEAERLQRLKEEHERREKRRADRDERMKKMEEKQQRRQAKTTARNDEPYEESEDEDSSSAEEETSVKKGKKRRKRGKKKKDRPWDSSESSEKSSESEEDGLEDLHAEENEELVFKSDHEFSPESDLDDDPEKVQPTKLARTARAGVAPKKRGRAKVVKEEVEEEEEDESDEEEEEEKDFNCQKCGQADHPEWILLCDRCDSGWHANCVKPPLMIIPEGDWFCPPCDHATLLERLQERLEAYEFLLGEKEAEMQRKKEQELAAAELAEEEADDEEEIPEEDDDVNSGAEDQLVAAVEGVEDEESSNASGEDDEEEDEDEDEEDDAEASQNESEENLNMRRQRKAAKQANYSFKDYDDMIKSALRDEGVDDEEEEDDEAGKGTGKGPRDDKEYDAEEDDEGGKRSPPGVRPSGIGNKRISTSDDDSDIAPRVIRKKKSRKLNDLSASSDGGDDSDEDFAGSSAEGSDSEEDDEDASESGSSFVVDDDSDSDVVDVSVKKRARPASPTIRRSTRNSRKKYSKMDSSDDSEDESDFEIPASKRKRGNDSWDSSGESSSDASWGRSKKRKNAGKSRAPPPPKAKPKPKPKPKAPTRKAPAKGRGGRGSRAGDSEDEPFRTSVSVKKIKAQAQPVQEEEGGGDSSQQRRTTRGRQISYKDLISSGESADENPIKAMGTLFAADRAAAARGGSANRRGRGAAATGRGGSRPGSMTTTKTEASVITAAPARSVQEESQESRFSNSADGLEFSSAVAAAAATAAVYTASGDDSHPSNDILAPSIDPELVTLPTILPQEIEVPEPVILKESDLPAAVALPPDLQVSRLIQRAPEAASVLPPDLQINRLIGPQAGSSSPAQNSPVAQRLLIHENPTPPPSTPPLLGQRPPSADRNPLHSGSGVIKQTNSRHSLPPTPPIYSGPLGSSSSSSNKTAGGMDPTTTAGPSVIRPYPTTAVPSSMSSSNPLSIQGLLSSPGAGLPQAPRPYGNTSHMIGHGPFLNHPSVTPYGSPYGAGMPGHPSRSTGGYMGTPVTPTPRPAYPPMYPSHIPPPPSHGLQLHSPYPQVHHGPPLRPTSSYQHAGFPQAFAAAAAAAANAEEERRIYRVAQANREAEGFDGVKGGPEDVPPVGISVPPESEFGGLVSYFSSQQEDFEEA